MKQLLPLSSPHVHLMPVRLHISHSMKTQENAEQRTHPVHCDKQTCYKRLPCPPKKNTQKNQTTTTTKQSKKQQQSNQKAIERRTEALNVFY